MLNIDPKYLVVSTGYDQRYCEKDNLKHFEEMILEDTNLDFEDEEDQVKVIGLVDFDNNTKGLKFQVRDITNVSEILRFYRGWHLGDVYVNWYCTCFDIDGMKYDEETRTLYVSFDAESG
ncbi:MAG: hypothetical protein JSS09_02005 [Verrucomicrobia bacterium]|nr:hypothetical protein [Verrucomicrobiota bacterium]